MWYNFSGGPASVYNKDSPHVKKEVWNLIKTKNIPVLGIRYTLWHARDCPCLRRYSVVN